MNLIEIPVVFTDEEALRAMGLPDEMLEEMRPMILRSREAARPKALYGQAEVSGVDETGATVGGVRMESRILSVNLSGPTRAIPYVCTCGLELDNLSQQNPDPTERYFQDMLNEMVLHKAIEELRERVKAEYSLDPLYAMSPGSLPDWPLPAQGPLFQALGDVTGQTGIALTQDYLMLPIKSVSGIFFTAEQEYVNCMLCNMQACPGRRAPYDPDLYQRRFAANMT